MFHVKTSIDVKEVDNLIKKFRDSKLIKVGVLGGEQDGHTLASIGQMQEFGSIIKKIPRRSFIKDPLMSHLGQDIKVYQKKLKDLLFAKKEIDSAYNLLGIICQRIIQQSFINKNDGKWPRNAPYTIKQKGVDNPLIWTGRLRRSITFEVINSKL